MKTPIFFAALAIVFCSCEKAELPAPVRNVSAHAAEPCPSRRLTLDMLDVHLVDEPNSQAYRFQEGGYQFEWTETNESWSLLFQVDVNAEGTVTGITGRYNGRSFILHDGVINICGGPQGVHLSYSLKQ